MTGKILVVEDQFLVGIDLVQLIEELGFEAFGPVTTVTDALALLDHAPVSMAILVLNLGSELSTPIAKECLERGIPFIVASAYDDIEAIGGAVFKGILNVGKPHQAELILSALIEAADLLQPCDFGS
jgi:two-component system, response regulator PdtaR